MRQKTSLRRVWFVLALVAVTLWVLVQAGRHIQRFDPHDHDRDGQIDHPVEEHE